MHPDDQYIITGILYVAVSSTISIFSTILFLKKLDFLRTRLIAYSILFITGLLCFFIWPLGNNGQIVFLESLIGFGLIIPVCIVLLVRYFANLNKNVIEQKIKDAKIIAHVLNLEVKGIEESINSNKNFLSYSGKLTSQYPFSISETIDFFNPIKGVNKTVALKTDNHFTVFRFNLINGKSAQFRIFTNQNHYAKVENTFENADNYKPFNTELEQKFSILYSKSSNLKQFFDKPRIQLLLINNYDNIRGYLDFNIEDGLCVLKSASPSQNNINIFNSNWRDQVNQLTINDIKSKLDFVNALLEEFLEFEAYAQSKSYT
jgi:hypothetical protein